MTFEKWWETKDLEKAQVPLILKQALKDLTKEAWDASRNCPVCGKDLMLPYCPNLHTLIEHKTKTRELKWHYFYEDDPKCSIYNVYANKQEYFTACGKDPKNIKRYTDEISQVTCLKCLKRINHELDN